MHYQPIVSLDTPTTDRFEALVRWNHPRHGLVGPMEFLPDAEEIGLIVPLGRWVIDEVCRQIAVWQQTYDGTVNVSVNISHREFSDPGLQAHILECIRRNQLSPDNLTVEITETVIRRNPGSAYAVIEQLHEIGIGVLISGVGTGMSSLQALRRFPIQALKIDRAFIKDLANDPRTPKLVQMIIDIGKGLGLEVVAEGVESAAQLELLRKMGCRTAQGFWFAEPVDGTAAAQLLGRTLIPSPTD